MMFLARFRFLLAGVCSAWAVACYGAPADNHSDIAAIETASISGSARLDLERHAPWHVSPDHREILAHVCMPDGQICKRGFPCCAGFICLAVDYRREIGTCAHSPPYTCKFGTGCVPM